MLQATTSIGLYVRGDGDHVQAQAGGALTWSRYVSFELRYGT